MASIVVNGDTSGSITLSAPAVAGSSVLTLPAVTDTVAGIAATQTLTNKSIVATQLTGTIAAARLPAGSVLQVVQANLTTTLSWTGDTTYHSILSASITPTSASSKILVQCHVQLASQSSMANVLILNATRGATTIVKNTSGGATDFEGGWGCYGGPSFSPSGRLTMMYSMNFLDSPVSTSALTYAISAKLDNASNTAYVGSWSLNNDAANITSLLLMEVAA